MKRRDEAGEEREQESGRGDPQTPACPASLQSRPQEKAGPAPGSWPPSRRKMTTSTGLGAARGALTEPHRAPREGSAGASLGRTPNPRPFSLHKVGVERRREPVTTPKGASLSQHGGAGWAEWPELGRAQHSSREAGARRGPWGALRPRGGWQGSRGTIQRKQRGHGLRGGKKPGVFGVGNAGLQHQRPLGG